jgi:hypothetical protein
MIDLLDLMTSGVMEEEGAFGIFGVGAFVDCCHCFTEILSFYIK